MKIIVRVNAVKVAVFGPRKLYPNQETRILKMKFRLISQSYHHSGLSLHIFSQLDVRKT